MCSVKARGARLVSRRGVLLMSAVLLATARPVPAGALLHFQGAKFNDFTLAAVNVLNGAIVLDTARAVQVTDSAGPAKGRTYFLGTALSKPLPVAGGFREMILSWDASCPQGSWIILEARAMRQSGWSEWFNLGYWTSDDFVFKRTSVRGQNTPEGRVDTDTLIFKEDCGQAQVRVSLCSLSSAMIPSVRRIVCDFSGPAPQAPDSVSRIAAEEVVLDVPEISQLSYPPRGNVWCSPTSVTMVMNYWAAKMGRKDWETDVRSAAAGIRDESWGGTGNWSFNVAYAGSRAGLAAYCTRMEGLDEAERWVRAGVPVVLSISANVLHGNGSSGAGHLIVCAGFNKDGDAICNDPFARLEKGQKVRRTYNRQKLQKAWESSRCAAYLIFPESLSLPAGMAAARPAEPEAIPAARPGS